ncbi:MAG: single-stranded DNA-binding protein [Actinomycetota bacterium]|nr:single-stranded DNA-binding protein [Actinomycetota bacterium]
MSDSTEVILDEEGIVADTDGELGAEEGADKLTGQRLLEREGDVAADYLEALLDITDLDGDIDIDIEGNRAMISVVEVKAGDLHLLVGDDGEVLNALQELTRLAAARETGERSRLLLDIGGHRAARRAALVAEAKVAIEEARSTGEPVQMAPMTAFERKVVHDAVADAGLISESEGGDPDRYVVIRVS